jgi:translation initiation factor 4E
MAQAQNNPLKYTWVFSFMHRQAGSKIQDYTSEIQKLCTVSSVSIANEVQDFWSLYSSLKRPGELGNISDYHVFKEGIRPTWEDNLTGGKWIVVATDIDSLEERNRITILGGSIARYAGGTVRCG